MKKYYIFLIILLIINTEIKSQDLYYFQNNGLWGYKNNNDSIIIIPEYKYAEKFILGYAIVGKNMHSGVIDKNNNIIVSFEYDVVNRIDTSEFSFGYRKKYFGEYLYGVITNKNIIKINAEYDYIKKYKKYYELTKNEDSIIDRSGFGDTRAIKSRYGLADKNGKIIFPCEYDRIDWKNDTLLVLGKKNLEALYTTRGKQLTDFIYFTIGDFDQGLAKVGANDKFGFMRPDGTIAIPLTLDYCEDFNNGYAIIFKGKWSRKKRETIDGKWGAINKRGKVVVKPIYEYEEVKQQLLAKKK